VNLIVPEPSLVVLIGPAGAGKSTFAAKHFLSSDVVSSDACRALVSGDENDMAANDAAFRLLHTIAREHLSSGGLAVIDATNVKPTSRTPLVALAREHGCPAVAILFDLPEELCIERNGRRSNRSLPAGVIHRQWSQMKRSQEHLSKEGFDRTYVLDSVQAVDSVVVTRPRRPRHS
jgi:protein phosphatase